MCTVFKQVTYADTVAGLKPDFAIVTVQLNLAIDKVLLIQFICTRCGVIVGFAGHKTQCFLFQE